VKYTSFLVIIMLSAISILFGCRPPQPQPVVAPVVQPTLSAEDFPRLDSSTSAEAISAAILCHALEVDCEWVEWIGGDRRFMPSLERYAGEFPGFMVSGTHQSYLNLADGEADLIFAARAPSQDELLYASGKSVVYHVTPLALDAFVFIVNEDNPVGGLTSDQIRAIYTGSVLNWAEVGWDDRAIHPYQRNDTSGSQELMRNLVMKGQPMIDAPDLTLPTMMAPFNAISTDAAGLGYSVYFYEEHMAPEQERVKPIAIDGVFPDKSSIQAKTYPYTTEVYMVTRADLPADDPASQLRAWLLTPAGQALVAASGYVPYVGS
jgi:phosphate transport system substrate-binding protein